MAASVDARVSLDRSAAVPAAGLDLGVQLVGLDAAFLDAAEQVGLELVEQAAASGVRPSSRPTLLASAKRRMVRGGLNARARFAVSDTVPILLPDSPPAWEASYASSSTGGVAARARVGCASSDAVPEL